MDMAPFLIEVLLERYYSHNFPKIIRIRVQKYLTGFLIKNDLLKGIENTYLFFGVGPP